VGILGECSKHDLYLNADWTDLTDSNRSDAVINFNK
jgi:hypothetical protein